SRAFCWATQHGTAKAVNRKRAISLRKGGWRRGAAVSNPSIDNRKSLNGFVHLDAGFSPLSGEILLGLAISSGKGSPSAHTAPFSKYSFFQIGTVFFSVSISQRQ